jgi:FADH2 O2-dependent halogenase
MQLAAEIAILGTGFGGTLTALVLHRLGRRVVLIDRGSHPRFLIGESSTPIADLVWQQLCERYELAPLAPLAHWGTWQRTYPQLACGLKRGFSYFRHHPDHDFEPQAHHAHELLVAASNRDETADTHWYRPDFDQFLVAQARHEGIVVCEQTTLEAITDRKPWRLVGRQGEQPVEIHADFLIDATGEGGFLPGQLRIPSRVETLRTRSRSIFGHFTGVDSWGPEFTRRGGALADHPFPCDDAALHHVIDGGWMYVLRFNNGVTSAGFLLNVDHHAARAAWSAEAEWQWLLTRYPAIGRQFAAAQTTSLCGPLRKTGRLQRRWAQAAGADWALLPFSAYGLDALHSTGNAHTLRGVERLCDLLGSQWGQPQMTAGLARYDAQLAREIDVLDQVVAACYEAFADFRLFTSFAMSYFAGAIFSEVCRRQGKSGLHDDFLLADQPDYRGRLERTVAELRRRLAVGPSTAKQAEEFQAFVAREIEPYNLAGLCDPSRRNMYPYLD